LSAPEPRLTGSTSVAFDLVQSRSQAALSSSFPLSSAHVLAGSLGPPTPPNSLFSGAVLREVPIFYRYFLPRCAKSRPSAPPFRQRGLGRSAGTGLPLICLNLGPTVDRGMADQNAGVFQCDGCGRKVTEKVFAVGRPTPPDTLERRPPPPCRHCGGTSWTRIGDAPDPNSPPPPPLP